jgi:hypothetical protein
VNSPKSDFKTKAYENTEARQDHFISHNHACEQWMMAKKWI